MTNYTNFYYDPVRQGFDSSEWRNFGSGSTPIVGGNYLMISETSIIHLGDIWRGSITMGINISAPAAGDHRAFGLNQYNRGAYAYFLVTDSTFTAETSNGTTSNSVAITWQSEWSSTDTRFKVMWEGGTAKFYVNSVLQAAISDVSVPGDPLSLYLSNTETNALNLKYIEAKAIQTFLMHTSLEDSTQEPVVIKNDRLTITESVTLFSPLIKAVVNESMTITESITDVATITFAQQNQAVTITESVALIKT